MVTKLSRHSTHPNPIKDKITVYSGHDATLRPLLLALRLPLTHWPPYASRLIFELYKPVSSKSQSEYLFKIIYNGRDVTRQLPFCVTRIGWTYSGCALNDLINYFHNMLGGMEYVEACKSSRTF